MLALAGAVLLSVVAQDKQRRRRRRAAAPAEAKEVVCFESRKGATEVTQRELKPGLPNVKCSPTTGAALWYGDPYDGTVPMGKMPNWRTCPKDQAVVKPRTEKLNAAGGLRHGLPQRHLPEGLPDEQRAGADPDDGSAWCPS